MKMCFVFKQWKDYVKESALDWWISLFGLVPAQITQEEMLRLDGILYLALL